MCSTTMSALIVAILFLNDLNSQKNGKMDISADSNLKCII